MTKSQVLIDQIKSTYSDKAWHGPSLMIILEDVDYIQALTRPLNPRHTIWEIVDHMTAWINVPIMTMLTGEYPQVSFEENWPKMGDSEEDWQTSIQKFGEAITAFITAVSELLDKKYDEVIKGKEYDYQTLLYGALNHNLYHMGQISILKRKVEPPTE